MRSGTKLNHAGLASILFAIAIAICVGVVLTVSATPAMAQSSTGTISGQVTDQQNAVIAGAEIRAVDPTTNSTRTT
jgi:hypothetical protein